jgi:hypothetical protein
LSVVHCRKSAALQKMSFATGFVTWHHNNISMTVGK